MVCGGVNENLGAKVLIKTRDCLAFAYCCCSNSLVLDISGERGWLDVDAVYRNEMIVCTRGVACGVFFKGLIL